MIILPSHGRVASVRGLDAGRLLVLVPHLLPRVAAPPVCLQRRRRLPLLPHVVSGPVPPERAALIRGLPLHGRGDPLFRRHPVQGGTALPDLRYVVQAASSWCAVGALRRCGGGALLLQLRAEGGVIVCSFNLGDLLIY